jgi:hypothetical protein
LYVRDGISALRFPREFGSAARSCERRGQQTVAEQIADAFQLLANATIYRRLDRLIKARLAY